MFWRGSFIEPADDTQKYGLKLFCVEGFSEDENDSPYSAMMEQMLAVFSAF